MTKRLMLGLLLLTVATPGWAVSDPAEMLADPALEARAEAVGAQLRCLVCQNESIEDSGAPLARDLRQMVRAHIQRGESDRQIMDWMVARYGNFIRLRPPLNASTLLLWIMPALALLIAAAAAALGFRAHRSAPVPLSDSERAHLDRLLEPR